MDYHNRFQEFTHKYYKDYNNDDEYQLRYNIFKENVDIIDNHNKEKHSWTMEINEFTDMTWNEFRNEHITYNELRLWNNDNTIDYTIDYRNAPDEWDWTEKGAVTPVKNQGSCGSCWAFSTTGSVEGAWFVETGDLVSISEQQLIDCSDSFGNQGCNGGIMNDGFKYIIENGICHEVSYPYTAKDGTCNTCTSSLVKVSSFKNVLPNNENVLRKAVFQQPVSVALEADQTGWHFYSSGVMDGNCGTNLDHGVLIVGYGTLDGKDYWKVKNSWGENWGDEGYILLVRNVEESQGQCGIAMQPSYPVVNNC